jgi:hypothetical protein
VFLPHSDVTATTEATAAAQRSILAQRAVVDHTGALVCRFEPRDSPGGALVRRIVVQGPVSSLARVYAGEPDPLNLADATASGWSDVADYAQPLYLPPYTPLVVVWTDAADQNIADPDGRALVRLELEDVG